MKVILNKCYGGFGISREGYELYCMKKGLTPNFYINDVPNYLIKKKDCDNLSFYCFLKDYGDRILETEVDWKTHLYLNTSYRDDPILIEVVEELGEKASGRFANLEVVDIPDDMDYVIDNYDGIETLHANVPTW
jgi:hypothetical protein